MDGFLNHLVGNWSLNGKMGEVALSQDVTARWVLKGLFVEMRFTSVEVGKGGNPDYEAIYLIGHDVKSDKYVLHLLDTFGVTSKPVPGIGMRKGNSIRFRFDYDTGPWFNTFTWMPATGAWRNIITHEGEGEEIVFAEKVLTGRN